MTYVPAHQAAAEDLALRGAPLAVYDWLLYRLEPHAFRPVKIAGIAYALRMKRDTVSAALRVLRGRGYLELRRLEHGQHSYRLCLTRMSAEGPLIGHTHPLA